MSVLHISRRAAPEQWSAYVQPATQFVETVELHRGMTLVLSQFEAGESRFLEFSEPGDMFGFGFHLRGGASFRLEEKRFVTEALDVWACSSPEGAVSRFVLPAQGFSTVSVRFEPEVAEEYFEGGRALPPDAFDVLRSAHRAATMARLRPMQPAAVFRLKSMFMTGYGGAARRLYLESSALELLADQIADADCHERQECSPAVKPRHREKAIEARNYLDTHFRDPPSVRELARIVGTNEFTLKRSFKSVFGVTMFGHVSRRRMEQAELLLRRGMSVSLAAHEVGYECVRSFSAAFRRHTRQSPSEVRRMRR